MQAANDFSSGRETDAEDNMSCGRCSSHMLWNSILPTSPPPPFSWAAPGDAVATMELRLCTGGSPGLPLSPLVDHRFPPGSPGSPPQTLITIPLSVTTRPNHCRQCLHQTTSKAGFLAARNDGCHSAEVHDPAKIEPFVRKESFVRMFSQIEPFSEIESNYHAHLLSWKNLTPNFGKT